MADGGKLLLTTVSHDNNTELLSLHDRILREQFGQEGTLVGRAFAKFRCHYKMADLRFGSVVDAMSYYRSLVYFEDAVARGVAGDLLLKAVTDGVAQAFERQGHFSCNKSSVTLIASNPRTLAAVGR